MSKPERPDPPRETHEGETASARPINHGDVIAAALRAANVGPLPVCVRSENSVRAYEWLVASGELPRRRLQTYTTLFLNGPMTRNELNHKAWTLFKMPAQFDKRLKEMADDGLLVNLNHKTHENRQARKCTITGHMCDLWDVAGRVPDAMRAPKVKRPKATKSRVPRPNVATLQAALLGLRAALGTPCASMNVEATLAWLEDVTARLVARG